MKTKPKVSHGYSKILSLMVKDGTFALLFFYLSYSIHPPVRLAGVFYYVCLFSKPSSGLRRDLSSSLTRSPLLGAVVGNLGLLLIASVSKLSPNKSFSY